MGVSLLMARTGLKVELLQPGGRRDGHDEKEYEEDDEEAENEERGNELCREARRHCVFLAA